MHLMLLCLLAPGLADKDTTDKYLDERGELAHTLTVTDLQSGAIRGVAVQTGRKWTIEPSGEWTLAQVAGKMERPLAKGKLTKKQLAGLAKSLETYDLMGLKSETVGKGAGNPHLITVEFGKTKAELTLPPGPLPGTSKTKVPGRFVGVLNAVQKRCIRR
jgi:hypothetical protein